MLQILCDENDKDVDDDDDDKYDEYDDDYDNDDDDDDYDDYSYCRLSVSPSGTASSATPPPLLAARRQFLVVPLASQQVRHPVWSTLIGPDPYRYCALIGWDIIRPPSKKQAIASTSGHASVFLAGAFQSNRNENG